MAGGARWTATEGGARLECGPLRGSVLLDNASASFVAERWQGRSLYGTNLLSYFGPSADAGHLGPAETYIRGGDFVANFAEGGQQKVTPQLYWRAECFEPFQAAKLELIVSVKTDLLDSQPLSRTHSLFSAEAEVLHAASLDPAKFETLRRPGDQPQAIQASALRLDASQSCDHLFVFRLPDHNLSIAQLVHPSDYVSADITLDRQPPYSLLTTLFPERLEKGVIRRGRVCGFFMPRQNDLEVACQLARMFIDAPLPLTA